MTTPTQAQIEAADIVERLRTISNTLLDGTSEDWAVLIAANMIERLTAAAVVGEQERDLWKVKHIKAIEAATIERCAQVVENSIGRGFHSTVTLAEVAAAIRALKDKP